MSNEQPFLGRARELAGLQHRYARPGGQLVLVHGRRRIGKSYLLEKFAAGKPTVFYQATQQIEDAELEAFTRAVQPIVGGEYLPAGYRFPSWGDALTFLSDRNRAARRLLVILDEFPYLADSTKGLPSIVQRWWDQHGRDSNIMLILCGSEQRFMEELDGVAAPLHQRFTAKFHILPLSYREAALFTPTLNAEDKARVYAVLGGTPLYLRQWNAEATFRDNLLALFGDPASSLVDSAEIILSTDLEDARGPYRALQAVALGATKHNEIRERAKISTDRTIQRLTALQLLEKRVPATDHRARSRRSIYVVADPYFRFYFRFIATNRGAIDRGLGQQVIDGAILPFFDTYMGHAFEDLASAFARELIVRGELNGDDVGSWWSTNGQHEIDIVGTAALRPTFIGSVKWRRDALGEDVLRDLERDASQLGIDDDVPRLLIGRGGVRIELAGRRGLRGYSIEDIYR